MPVFSLLARCDGRRGQQLGQHEVGSSGDDQPDGSEWRIRLANYAPAAGSPASMPSLSAQAHPSTDFFGNLRPSPSNPTRFDVGAVEFQGAAVAAPTLTSISPATGYRSTTSR